ncbi:AraC family transcriptional regulator [Bacillaceae bacterium SIJ1]|uniref:helix-turn-helix transcriptional regulator n=1 Tax=Litoribacterium kuwaitense TaxID=1398745 RepID=UPI0013EA868C|nr:AraC family transcriptional regulator [Litoribacterium kuwaitense]NGP45548.1 AraC family transcriptional regulator [Litoribacterium kuwaitense]
MKPIHKPLNPEGKLPFLLTYHHAKGQEEEWPDHVHEWCELVYIHEGEATFIIDQHVMRIKKGDLIFVPPNVIHRTRVEPDDLLTSSALYFMPTFSQQEVINHIILVDLFIRAKRRKVFRYSLQREEQKVIESYLFTMNEEIRHMRHFWEEATSAQIIQLMIQLHRWIDTLHSGAESTPKDLLWLKAVFAYMDDHLHEPIRLEELAQQACISPVYFSKKFKQTVGITVSEFLVKKRVLKAKELLRDSNESIQTIAEMSGHHSMPYFYRTFKKQVGETPAKYRKNGAHMMQN